MSLANPRPLEDADARPRVARLKIISALESVPDLTAYPVAPDQATAGAAWPKWVQTTYDGRLCDLGHDTYEVLVTLPAGYLATTVDNGDAYRDVVALSLNRVARIEYAEPVSIQFQDNQSMPGLRLRVTIE